MPAKVELLLMSVQPVITKQIYKTETARDTFGKSCDVHFCGKATIMLVSLRRVIEQNEINSSKSGERNQI